jgi:Protein of unknown function (DUF3228)
MHCALKVKWESENRWPYMSRWRTESVMRCRSLCLSVLAASRSAAPFQIAPFMSAAKMAGKSITIDPFAMRQFTDPNYAGSKISYPPQEFEDKINEHLHSGAPLCEGYAPFCKHLFIPNFANVPGAIVKISEDNEHLLRTGYEARTATELPVLLRWFTVGSVSAPTAAFLDIILYSREQIRLENAATG